MKWKDKLGEQMESGNMNDYDDIEHFIKTNVVQPLIADIQGFNRVADSYQNTRQRIKYIENQLKAKWLERN